jgi:hypothetical protein
MMIVAILQKQFDLGGFGPACLMLLIEHVSMEVGT